MVFAQQKQFTLPVRLCWQLWWNMYAYNGELSNYWFKEWVGAYSASHLLEVDF